MDAPEVSVTIKADHLRIMVVLKYGKLEEFEMGKISQYIEKESMMGQTGFAATNMARRAFERLLKRSQTKEVMTMARKKPKGRKR